jgi:NADH-quinone oxidoreductase subunit J
MLLDLGDEATSERRAGFALSGRRLAIAATAAGALAVVGIVSAGHGEAFTADPSVEEHGVDQVTALAEVLFTRYLLPFEASSLLLLATMIAVIALAKRQRPETAQSDEPLGWPWERGVEQ